MIRGTQSNVRKEVKHYLERAYEVYPIDNEVVLKYSEIYNGLRKEGKMIPEPDIIIGATAISRNRPLMTRDVHFERLQDYGLVLT
jgi:predicted nucleic acid-binding protein